MVGGDRNEMVGRKEREEKSGAGCERGGHHAAALQPDRAWRSQTQRAGGEEDCGGAGL